MSTISAGTTLTTALVQTGDTTGDLVIQTDNGNTTAATFSTGGNLTFGATGARIQGDFSNATWGNRVAFQTSTTNSATAVLSIPNGTSTTAQFAAANNSDPTNASIAQLAATSGDMRVISGITGTGSYLPLTMYTGGSERLRIDTSGNVGIGTSSPAVKMDIAGFANEGLRLTSTSTNGAKLQIFSNAQTSSQLQIGQGFATGTDNIGYIYNSANAAVVIGANGAERARISAAGGFSVGTTADPGAGAIYATGNITAYYSDDRLKTKLGGIENALDKVKSLSGFYYEANQTAQDLGYEAVREVGVSAQQVQAVMPEVVKPAPIDQQYLTVDYERLVPLLIEAIKELEEKVAKLEAK